MTARRCAIGSARRSRARATGPSPCGAPPSCSPGCAPTSTGSTCWWSTCACPHCPGAELIRTVRKLDEGRLPILAFSGTVSSADEVRELAALGVAGYVNEYSAVQHILPSLAPHLFPDNFNRRGSPRVVLGIPAAYHVGATIAAALSLNISRGGIAIRTTSPLEPMTKVRLRFRLPGSKKDFDIDAHVRWSDPRAGMGLQFDRVDPADQAAIDEFVDCHFFQPRRRDDAAVTPAAPAADNAG